MTVRYARHVSTRETPQSEPIPGKPMVPNSAGGFAFAVDDWGRLDRFLVLGSEAGSYYATERAFTVENADVVRRCLAADAGRTVARVVEVSESGRAPKNAPAVFALAIAASSGHLAAVAAADALRKTCRVPTDLFSFVAAVDALRGWGRGLRKLVAGWYAGKSPEQLAYHLTKYRQRDGWTHRDVLRLAHPVAASDAHQALYRWAAAGDEGLGDRSFARKAGPAGAYPAVSGLPPIVEAYRAAQKATDRADVVRLIRDAGLVREHVPTQWLGEPSVWEALLEKMPLHATVRNLGKMTSVGLLAPLSAASRVVAGRLGDGEYLRKSRLHPLAVLMAAKVYGQGHGERGKLAWTPVPAINDALDGAFYRCFANVVPAGKRTLLALDVSGSMGSPVAGSPLSCREAAAAMAMVAMKTEPACHVLAFVSAGTPPGRSLPPGLYRHPSGLFMFSYGSPSPAPGSADGIVPLDISACSRLSDVVARTANLPFGGTDCALPMTYALAKGIGVDTFVVLTDSETWANPTMHPCQALGMYREATGIPAKLAVLAFASNGFSIADPSDAGMMDFVGLDSATPAVLADFSRGGPAVADAAPSDDEVPASDA